MKVGIQFNQYDGMGGKLQVVYRIGYIELNSSTNSGTIKCKKLFDLPAINVEFNLESFRVYDISMGIKGTNKEGYGKVDCIFDSDAHCYNLALEENERARLRVIYNDTPEYYLSTYGDIVDINKVVRGIMEDKHVN